jgi:hypothetical protein
MGDTKRKVSRTDYDRYHRKAQRSAPSNGGNDQETSSIAVPLVSRMNFSVNGIDSTAKAA